MGVFNSQKTIHASLHDLKPVLADVKAYFEDRGFTVQAEESVEGGFISITKGGLFKDAFGLKSALNTTLTVRESSVFVEAKIGAFGGKAAALVGAYIAAWPLAITAAIGMVTQSKLDEEMINAIEQSVLRHSSEESSAEPGAVRSAQPVQSPDAARSEQPEAGVKFCTACGKKLEADAAFCSGCGAKQ